MTWHVIYADKNGLVRTRAALSRDRAIQIACELLNQSLPVDWPARTAYTGTGRA
jgi:hypothetical protein